MKEYIKINEKDNVVVALENIEAGRMLQGVCALQEIPAGHKMALAPISAGEQVIKYGYPIGLAKEDIKAGEWVHVHNLKTALGDVLDYQYEPVDTNIEPSEDVTFMGYNRPGNKVGVRNEIWIIPTVGCVNKVAETIAKLGKVRLADVANKLNNPVDDIIAFSHPYGCSQMGED